MIMNIDDYNLANDGEFLKFSQQIADDFIAFKISNCKDFSIVDSLLKYAKMKNIDEELLGECIEKNSLLKELISKEIKNEPAVEYSEW